MVIEKYLQERKKRREYLALSKNIPFFERLKIRKKLKLMYGKPTPKPDIDKTKYAYLVKLQKETRK